MQVEIIIQTRRNPLVEVVKELPVVLSNKECGYLKIYPQFITLFT